jgi:N-glycosylase/DNA lyase
MAKKSQQPSNSAQWAALLQDVLSEKRTLEDYLDDGYKTRMMIQKEIKKGMKSTFTLISALISANKLEKLEVNCIVNGKKVRQTLYRPI